MDERDWLAERFQAHRPRLRAAVRQLASRARRRVQGAAPVPDADLARQRAPRARSSLRVDGWLR
jgi:hypothetical protein